MEVELSLEEEGSGRAKDMRVEVEEGSTVADVLEAADQNPETVLVEHDGRIVPKGEEVVEATELRVLRVISGG